MQVNFELAHRQDIPTILGMMERFYQIDGYPFREAKSRHNLNLFLSNPELGRFWLIRVADEVAGYIVLAYGFSFEYGGRDAFIDEFFIEAPYRDRGIGRQTIEFVAEAAVQLGVHAIHLEVENHNDKGNRLYARQGFEGKERAMLTKWLLT
ncbi:GNAT family N-acetyltransferase [Flavilitoribacter nigricans]|uniref:GNAT family N-acetyltransferase n=1 Tax=Flavilitoribacter nigricans (strain ATCC 23147 / DSM 23189 / NBRC 102662 / NCIMB 1420 / SS-2) TaxID=1122177 RepID=A0A2D0NI85_FLAN2|nr:GNAT family N-acetyltransferase [Flavilitoribacter nigricans]PHN08201.1 GNAT family N-acetyltransferase [Flavilitoribacter nigricans DSM 23189 = NBRC 102662]